MLPVAQVRQLLADVVPAELAEVARDVPRMAGCKELRVLGAMRLHRLEVYAFHRNALAASCRWPVALQLLGRKLQRRNTSAAVQALKRSGQWRPALALLAACGESSIQVDVSGRNAMASALELASWPLSLAWMPQELSQEALLAYHSLLRRSQWHLATGFWSSLRCSGACLDCIGLNALLSPMARGGEWQRLLQMEIFRSRLSDSASYSTAMESCRGAWPIGLQLLSTMPSDSFRPDRIHATAVADSCSKGGHWEAALHVFSCVDTWDLLLGTSALSASKPWHLALHTLDMLPEKQVEPNSISSTAALSACERGRQWNLAVLVFEDMLQQGSVNEICLGAAMLACEKASKWQLLASYLTTMSKLELRQSSTVYVNLAREANSRSINHLRQASTLVAHRLQPKRALRGFLGARFKAKSLRRWQNLTALRHFSSVSRDSRHG